MDTLVLKNNGSSLLTIQDLGVEVLVGEDLDLIPTFKNEEIIESLDFASVFSRGGQVVLTSNGQQFIMTYQDVIDYLTPLTKWSKIDYQYISDRDDTSDITAEELEELTSGDDTLLHNHDNRYYTETELATPGQSTIHWQNITGFPAADTKIVGDCIYFFDSTRNKWLSTAEMQYTWAESVVDGKYLSIGGVISINAGYIIPNNMTLTKIAFSSSGHPTKQIEIRLNNTSIYNFSLVNGNYISNLNIDINAGDLLKIFVSGTGNPITDTVAMIYGKWRLN